MEQTLQDVTGPRICDTEPKIASVGQMGRDMLPTADTIDLSPDHCYSLPGNNGGYGYPSGQITFDMYQQQQQPLHSQPSFFNPQHLQRQPTNSKRNAGSGWEMETWLHKSLQSSNHYRRGAVLQISS